MAHNIEILDCGTYLFFRGNWDINVNGQRAIVIFSDVFLGAISRKFGQGKGDCISWVIKLNVIFFPVTLGGKTKGRILPVSASKLRGSKGESWVGKRYL